MELKKNKDIDLNRSVNRAGYLSIGGVFALAVTLCYFEYTSFTLMPESLESKYQDERPDDFIPPILDFAPPPPPPPPPPRPPIADEVDVLEDDDQEEDDFQVVDQEDDAPPPPPPPPPPPVDEKPVVEEIFDVVEEAPEPMGGMQALYDYLGKEVKYPQMAMDNNIQGKVYVQFVVEKDGSINDVNVVKGVHNTLDKEATRVVKAMPKWKPGKQRGKAVRVRYTIPINFTIN